MKSILRIALLFSYVGMIGSFAATNDTWTSTSSSDFNTPGNWSLSAVPTTANTDIAYFASPSSVQTSVTIASTPASSIYALQFISGAPSYTLSGAGMSGTGTLTIDPDTTSQTICLIDASANTQYLEGIYILQNSGTGGSLQFQLTAGDLDFTLGSSLTIDNTFSEFSGGGNMTVAGSLTLASGVAFNWNSAGSSTSSTLYYDPSSMTRNGSTATLESTKAGSIIELQAGLSTSTYSSLTVGGSLNTGGTVYLDAPDPNASVLVPVAVNIGASTNTFAGTGTYILGMNDSSAAAATVSGKVTLYNYGTTTDQFDVTSGNTLTISGQIVTTGTTGTPSITKTSAGTLILSNSSSSSPNTYTGPTAVNAGTLGVQSKYAIPTTTALSVASGANFAVGNAAGGSYIGPVGPTVASLSLTSTGSSVGNEAELSFNIGGTSYDSFTSSGAFTLNGAGTTFELNVNVVGGSTGTDTLLTWLNAGSTNLSLSNVDLVVNGTDIGTSNSTYLTLNTGTNDSIAFNAAAAPEPRAWALMLGGVGLLVFVTRRRAIRSDI